MSRGWFRVSVVALPASLKKGFAWRARELVLNMTTSSDLVAFFEDDHDLSARHLDAFLSLTACEDLPERPSGTVFATPSSLQGRPRQPPSHWQHDASELDVFGESESARRKSARDSESAVVQTDSESATEAAGGRESASASLAAPGRSKLSRSSLAESSELRRPIGSNLKFPWTQHRSCESRVASDWIVGVLQFEAQADSLGSDGSGSAGWPGEQTRTIPPWKRHLLNAAPLHNVAYRVYSRDGHRYLATQVCQC